jgi:hypothetical protein
MCALVRTLLPSMTTPVPMTSTGACLDQGRVGFGSRSEAKTRTTESSGPSALAPTTTKRKRRIARIE